MYKIDRTLLLYDKVGFFAFIKILQPKKSDTTDSRQEKAA